MRTSISFSIKGLRSEREREWPIVSSTSSTAKESLRSSQTYLDISAMFFSIKPLAATVAVAAILVGANAESHTVTFVNKYVALQVY